MSIATALRFTPPTNSATRSPCSKAPTIKSCPRLKPRRSRPRCGRRNIPHVYHLYEGEGHGWRKPETVRAFYQACEAFLRQHVLFA